VSTVDEAEVLRNTADPDPSAASGRPGRLDRRMVLIFGFAFAAVVAFGVGLVVYGFASKTTSFVPAKSAAIATPPPSPATPLPNDAAHNRSIAAKAAGGNGGDTNDDPNADHGGKGNDGGNNNNAPPQATPTPTVADRIADLQNEMAVADEQHRLIDERKARDASEIVAATDDTGSPLSASASAAGLPASVPASAGFAPVAPPPLQSPPPLPDDEAPAPPGQAAAAGGGMSASQGAERRTREQASAAPSPGARTDPGASSPFAIREGDALEIALQPNLDSDRPGIVSFYVRKDVKDSDYGGLILIPRGTAGIAKVAGASVKDRVLALTIEKLRLGPTWIPFPGSVDDANMDHGLTASVNDHHWPLFFLTAISGALSGLNNVISSGSGSVVIDSSTRPPVPQEVLGGMGTAMLGYANQEISKSLDRPPSLTVKHEVTALLQTATDIPLLPYCDPHQPDTRECKALQYLQERNAR
jgi:type IV secretory pathway VirB10-like protein